MTRRKNRPARAAPPTSPRVAPARSPRLRAPIYAAAGVLLVSAAGIWRWLGDDVAADQPGSIAERNVRPSPPASTAGRAAVDPGFLGVVLSGDSVAIEPKVEGRIVTLSVHAGDHVPQGAIIAALDRTVHAEDLRGARAAFADASRRFARRAALATGPDPAVTAEEVDSARAQLAQERARLGAVTAALAETEVVAPFAGTVAEIYLAPGALAGPGRPVARLVSQGDLQVRFAMPETGATAVVAGAPIDVEIGSLGLRVRGIVTGVNPEVDASSRMIFAAARLDVAQAVARRLTTGLVARVRPAPIAPLELPPFAASPERMPLREVPPSLDSIGPASVAADDPAASPSSPAPRARARRARGPVSTMPRW